MDLSSNCTSSSSSSSTTVADEKIEDEFFSVDDYNDDSSSSEEEEEEEENVKLFEKTEMILQELDAIEMHWYQNALQDERNFWIEVSKNSLTESSFVEEKNEKIAVIEDLEEIQLQNMERLDSTWSRCDSCIDDDDWVVEEIVRMKRSKGILLFLVKWKRFPDPSWESEEIMLDEGFGREVSAFKKNTAAKNLKSVRRRKRFTPKQKSIELFSPQVYWTDYVAKIQDLFVSNMRCCVKTIQNIVNEKLAVEFTKQWLATECTPVMVFHGTAERNIPSIVKNGLLIPGKGNSISVVNGSAYGIGIYTAVTPSVSSGYTRGHNKMFVCAVLVGEKYQAFQTAISSYIVIFQKNLVLPCFLVEWTNGMENESSVPLVIDTPFDYSIDCDEYLKTTRKNKQSNNAAITPSFALDRRFSKRQLRGQKRVVKKFN